METKLNNGNTWLSRPILPRIKWNWETAIFAIIIVLAIVSRFYDLGERVMSHDESLHTYFSWAFTRTGQFEHTPLMHGPLQFHLIGLSYFIFGDSDFTARIPAVLASILTIVFLWNYRRYLGRSGTLAAAAMFLISPFMLYYGRYVRNEALVALFGVVTIWAILRYLDSGEKKYFLWLGAATALHFTAKETSFIYTAQALLFLLILFLQRVWNKRWGRSDYQTIFKGVIIVAVLMFILAGVSFQYGDSLGILGGTETAVPFDPGLQTEEALPGAVGSTNFVLIFAGIGGVGIAAGLLLTLAGLPEKRAEGQGWRQFWLSGAGLAVGSILLWLFAKAEHNSAILQNYFGGETVTGSSLLEGTLSAVTAPTLYLPLLSFILGLGLMYSAYKFTKSVYKILPALRGMRTFELMMLLGSLILPHLSAIIINQVGWAMGDYNGIQTIQFVQIAIILIPVILTSVGIGWAWGGKVWVKNAAVFYAIFGLFFTSFFTHGAGFFTGMVASLGYWLFQQEVERGSQPQYYYMLIQLPVYEYLAGAATLLAGWFGLRWWGRGRNDKDEIDVYEEIEAEEELLDQPEEMTHSDGRRLGLIFLAYWVVTSLGAYSIAGEKMPWLSVHITLPMLLLGGWAIGRLIDTLRWHDYKEKKGWVILLILPVFLLALAGLVNSFSGPTPPFQGSELGQLKATNTFIFNLIATGVSGYYLTRLFRGWELRQQTTLILLMIFGGLGILTVRTSMTASYINHDRATEFLVYAHSARGVKDVMEQVDDLSARLTDGKNLQIGYDPDVSWPFSWYLRNYPNARLVNDFGSDLKNFPVLIIGNDNWGNVEPIVARSYFEFEYIRMWWPNQDYFGMTWERLASYITDPNLRNGLQQIWLDRDYSAYAQATGKFQELNLQTWSPSDRMRMYVRKDVAAQIWDYGVEPVPDPYEKNILLITPDIEVGGFGIEAGEFSAPRSMALAADGSIYIADSFNHRIQHMDRNGTVIDTWGTLSVGTEIGPAEDGTFREPWGVALSPDGRYVYVADTWNHRVQKFTSEGDFITAWGTFGDNGVDEYGFYGPRGI
ncbi:MAG: TIGR03663 family protein, partial [Anaerolineae bacterium]|nr:TIGR03663 family protein [Anaerolineae bacterium]